MSTVTIAHNAYTDFIRTGRERKAVCRVAAPWPTRHTLEDYLASALPGQNARWKDGAALADRCSERSAQKFGAYAEADRA